MAVTHKYRTWAFVIGSPVLSLFASSTVFEGSGILMIGKIKARMTFSAMVILSSVSSFDKGDHDEDMQCRGD
jgi:hypothetical protein